MEFDVELLHCVQVCSTDGESSPGLAADMPIGPLRAALTRYFRARIRDENEAEDLVQDVFARIAARQADEPIMHLERYVFQTAASVLADRSRRRQVRHADDHVEFDPDHHGAADLDPHHTMSAREDLRSVTAAMLTLPVRTRTIFILHRLEGQRYREVAEQLGISVSAVEKHMARAIQHLSQSLGAIS